MILKGRIPYVFIIKELKSPLFFVTFISIVFGILLHYFDSFLSDIPISIATILGVAISILLSYKINQSYDRWWEARKIWGEIRNGGIQVLTAIDVAARGLDIEDVSHVINYQLPGSMDSYIHRIGRTGRAGKIGHAITLMD